MNEVAISVSIQLNWGQKNTNIIKTLIQLLSSLRKRSKNHIKISDL